MVVNLLKQLAGQANAIGHVVITHNLPEQPVEAPEGGWPFVLTEIANTAPAGFGVNHNRAFDRCTSALFCILNPDISLVDAAVWPGLLACVREEGVGCAYPALYNEDGSRQENERELVTPAALVRRHLGAGRQRRTDWASAAFWLVPAATWRQLGGFDERYFMYCEDVDFCLRLQLAGLRLARCDATAVHKASWGSRRMGSHLAWHLRSMLRLWTSASYWRYLRTRPAG